MYHTTFEKVSFEEPKIPFNENSGIYLDILTDFGFKHIFGKETNKDILIDFLNALFQGRKIISDISYNNIENNGAYDTTRDVFFDLLCTGADGEQFIVEMQRRLQPNFIDRCVFYTSRIINDQAPLKGDYWNYKIKGVFLIAILDFELKENNTNHCLTPVELINLNTKELFYDKLGYIFLELRKFNKKENELISDLDKWCYLLKHLHQMNETPSYLNKRVFNRIFKLAKISTLSPEERMALDLNLKSRRDWNNTIAYAVAEATAAMFKEKEAMFKEKEAMFKEKEAELQEIVRTMHHKGFSIETIHEITKLNVEVINNYLT
jgi:predicted transposase/invertase (TIGR01784 family)